ncbi:MAG: hypothetical protein LWW85_11710 [Marinilabiliales bacterium]|nr:hypothetical protein [Marinilabiliales bacterium]
MCIRLCLVLMVATLGSCSYFGKNDDSRYAAKVGDKIFSLRELRAQIPAGLTRADSLQRANDILVRWVKKELMIQMAEDNLDGSQKDLTKELDDYRNELLIHRYKQQLLSQKLDTALTPEDIREYYDKHPEKFILPSSIVKAVYVEIPKNVAKIDLIRRWMIENSTISLGELESYSFQYATKFDRFNKEWTDLSGILARIPGVSESPESILRGSKIHQFSDLNNYYFLLVNDYILAGEKAPFDFVKDRIESLILNSRKMDFLREIENNVYEKGKRENRFTIR